MFLMPPHSNLESTIHGYLAVSVEVRPTVFFLRMYSDGSACQFDSRI